MDEILKPATEWELKGMLTALGERRIPVEVMGSGTKRDFGKPMSTSMALTTTGLRGITLYEPSELVMSARAGTLLSNIEVELASRGQMLPFEPIDLGPMLGTDAGVQTIGGVFAGNLSGPRRVVAGAARDVLIGLKGINGRSEEFKSGGRVMKNVTGYDVARGLCGSWGTLAVMTELTFKVLPLPDDVVTLLYPGLTDELAVELLSLALTLPFEVSGTIHLSAALAKRLTSLDPSLRSQSLTAIRLENFTQSVAYRKGKLKEAFRAYGTPVEIGFETSLPFWTELRRFSMFPFGPTQIWRVSTAPKSAPKLVASIRRHMPVETYYDWSGGLVWIEAPETADAGAADVRRAVSAFGGHATLMRANRTVRSEVEVFQPLGLVQDRLTRGLKQAFDPGQILNPGRMYTDV